MTPLSAVTFVLVPTLDLPFPSNWGEDFFPRCRGGQPLAGLL